MKDIFKPGHHFGGHFVDHRIFVEELIGDLTDYFKILCATSMALKCIMHPFCCQGQAALWALIFGSLVNVLICINRDEDSVKIVKY